MSRCQENQILAVSDYEVDRNISISRHELKKAVPQPQAKADHISQGNHNAEWKKNKACVHTT
jgi:hypothetical protein